MIPQIRHQARDGGLILLTHDGLSKPLAFSGMRYRQISDAIVRSGAVAALGDHMNGFAMDSTAMQSFLVNQLAFTEATVYKKDFLRRTYEDLLPIKADGGMAVNEIRYEMSERKGKGRRINNQGDDIPTSNTEYGDRSVPVYTGGIGYEYDLVEIAQAALLRRSLVADKADAAMEGFLDHMNDVALIGESPLPSFFAFSGVAVSTITGDGWSVMITAGLSDVIIDQLNAQIAAFYTATGESRYPDTLCMSARRMSILNRPRASGSDKTILQYFLETNTAKMNGVDLKIITSPASDDAGAGGLDRLVLYIKRPDIIRMQIPVPLQFLSPQLVNLKVKIPGMYRYGGVEVVRPNSVLYIDPPDVTTDV